jgi:hypothetical protein
VICDTSRHCRRYAQRSVNPSEVVVQGVERVRGDVIFKLLGKAVRQSREAAHAHLHRQVLALNEWAHLRHERKMYPLFMVFKLDHYRTVGEP